MVGAARIDFVDDNLGGIRWAGPTAGVGNLTLNAGGKAFGFTGCTAYLGETTKCPNGNWKSNSTRTDVIAEPKKGAYLNHFFAPLVEGTTQSLHKYYTIPHSDRYVNVESERVLDSSETPVTTLAATATVYDATSSEIGKIGLETEEKVKEARPVLVPVPSKGRVIFTITPRIDVDVLNRLKGDKPNLREVEYMLVRLQAKEHDTSCSDYYYLSFQDQDKGKNQFTRENYYHYLEAGGPNSTLQTCDRGGYAFLVEKNTSFQFEATNVFDTGSGHVEYLFYINGHYDESDLNKFKGSWQRFQLNAYTTLPVANFKGPTQGHEGQPFEFQLDELNSRLSTPGATRFLSFSPAEAYSPARPG